MDKKEVLKKVISSAIKADEGGISEILVGEKRIHPPEEKE